MTGISEIGGPSENYNVNCGIFDKMRNVNPYRYTNYVIGCGNNDYYGIGAAALEGALTKILTNKSARIFCKQNMQKMRGFNFFEANKGACVKCHK